MVRLADLDPADVDMRCLLIVGSSQTQWYSVGDNPGCSPRAVTRRRFSRTHSTASSTLPAVADSGRQRRAVDHHHRDAKRRRGIQLGPGHLTAAVLGHQHVDPVLAQQCAFAVVAIWAAG